MNLNTILGCRGFMVQTIYTNAKNIITFVILYWVYEKKNNNFMFRKKKCIFSHIGVNVQIKINYINDFFFFFVIILPPNNPSPKQGL